MSDSTLENYLLTGGRIGRRAEVEVVTRRSGAILRHDAAGYFALSAVGLFVWQQLDGRGTREVIAALLKEQDTFAPGRVIAILTALAESGFLETDVDCSGPATPARRVRDLLEWRAQWRGADAVVAKIYERVKRLLDVRVLCLVATFSVVAFVMFVANAAGLATTAAKSSLGAVFVGGWLASVVSVALHELGHALAVKHFGRTVLSVGAGWYWFGPVAFVDTSDMWLGTRNERIAVSLAGPFVNCVLGAVATFAALICEGDLAAFCALVATSNWIMAFSNMNPTMEFDGYYVLADVLGMPNLRGRALRWLGASLRSRPSIDELRAHRIEATYSLASAGFILVSVVVLFSTRDLVATVLTPTTGHAAAHLVAWCGAVLVSAAVVIGLAVDLSETRRI